MLELKKQNRTVMRVHICHIWRDRSQFMADRRGMTLKYDFLVNMPDYLFKNVCIGQ